MNRYTQPTSGGASMSGPVYEPQVTPYDRDNDDVRVVSNSKAERNEDDGPYAEADYEAEPRHRKTRKASGEDAWSRRDLVPTPTTDIEQTNRKPKHKAERKAQPWDDYHKKPKEELTAGYGEMADNFRAEGQYRQPWDDYMGRRR